MKMINTKLEETWTHEKSDGSKIYYPMRIFNGKDFNVLKLSNATNLNEIKEYADFLKRKSLEMYSDNYNRKEILNCPCCGINTKNNIKKTLKFIDITYNICRNCNHCYIAYQPSQSSFNEVFEFSEDHSDVYTQEDEIEFRINEIIIPKLNWCKPIQKSFKKEPSNWFRCRC